MLQLKHLPIDEDNLTEKLQKFAAAKNFTLSQHKKRDHLLIKIHNQSIPGTLRVYFTRKGVTIDGSTGKNKSLNEELLTYLSEVVTGDLEERRCTFKNIQEKDLAEILERIRSFADGKKVFSIVEVNSSEPSQKKHVKIRDEQSKEEVNMLYYTNKTLYLYGFSWNMGEEIINFICKVTQKVIPQKINYLHEIVHDCNESYLTDNGIACQTCRLNCGGDCDKLLRRIHFGGMERYNCEKIVNYYMPRYGYRYAFEMEKLLQQHAEEIERFPHLHILSVGCGPCTREVEEGGLEQELTCTSYPSAAAPAPIYWASPVSIKSSINLSVSMELT